MPHRITALLAFAAACALLAIGSPEARAARPPAPWAEGGPSRPEDLTVELFTFGPADEVVSWFGHTALAVRDRALGAERVYNFGMFAFGPHVVPEYLMGRLNFWVAPTPYRGTLRGYADQGRDVRVLELALDASARAKLSAELERLILPENREYLYHHYDDNCATRIRDLIDEATAGEFKRYAKSTPAALNLREHTKAKSRSWPVGYGMMLGMGGSIDRPITAWEEMFLPEELERHVKGYGKITGEERIVHQSRLGPALDELWTTALGLGLGAALLLGLLSWLALGRRNRAWTRALALAHLSAALAIGGASAALLFLWFVTDHDVCESNEDLFYATPLAIAAAWPAWRWARRLEAASAARLGLVWGAALVVALIGIMFQALPLTPQDSRETIALFVPVLAALAASARWAARRPLPIADRVV